MLLHNLATGELLQTLDIPESSNPGICISIDGTRAIVDCNSPFDAYILDLTPFTRPKHSPASERSPVFTWKHIGALGITLTSNLLGFSGDGRGVITTTGFAPFETREDWPLSAQRAEDSQSGAQQHLTMDYYLYEGWIWYVDQDTGPRRICWPPPLYRDIPPGTRHCQQGNMAVGHQSIAFQTIGRGLVILDLSKCHV